MRERLALSAEGGAADRGKLDTVVNGHSPMRQRGVAVGGSEKGSSWATASQPRTSKGALFRAVRQAHSAS